MSYLSTIISLIRYILCYSLNIHFNKHTGMDMYEIEVYRKMQHCMVDC